MIYLSPWCALYVSCSLFPSPLLHTSSSDPHCQVYTRGLPVQENLRKIQLSLHKNNGNSGDKNKDGEKILDFLSTAYLRSELLYQTFLQHLHNLRWCRAGFINDLAFADKKRLRNISEFDFSLATELVNFVIAVTLLSNLTHFWPTVSEDADVFMPYHELRSVLSWCLSINLTQISCHNIKNDRPIYLLLCLLSASGQSFIISSSRTFIKLGSLVFITSCWWLWFSLKTNMSIPVPSDLKADNVEKVLTVTETSEEKAKFEEQTMWDDPMLFWVRQALIFITSGVTLTWE